MKDNEAAGKEISDVAALAESIQPKGNTLSSTSVSVQYNVFLLSSFILLLFIPNFLLNDYCSPFCLYCRLLVFISIVFASFYTKQNVSCVHPQQRSVASISE